jgi:hypothetical protein
MFSWVFPSKKRRYEVAKLVFNQVYCSPKNSDLENSMPLQTPDKAPLPINMDELQKVTFCTTISIIFPFFLSLQEKRGRETKERIVQKVTFYCFINQIWLEIK